MNPRAAIRGGDRSRDNMKITVLGAGAWGTALACLLQQNRHHQVVLWGHSAEHLEDLRRAGSNERYLPGIKLSEGLQLETELTRAVDAAECVIIAVPSEAFRQVTRHLKSFAGMVVSVTKGIEYETGLTMCGILATNAPASKCATLSGPTFAVEVARGVPTAIVAASRDPGTAAQIQQLFNRPAFRVYTSTDLFGVELGGALKNVIAIGAGVCDGLGFGDNSKAALVTRAIVEFRRLGVACGAQPETFTGLSGLGDLMLTCFSRLSRNRGFGEQVGRGRRPSEIAAQMVAVAEGYPTARSAYQLAHKHKVSTPVMDEVYAMLYEEKDVRKAVHDLMSRDLKAEN